MGIVQDNIKHLMAQRGVSGYALGEATRIPQPTIWRIITGESQDPKTKTLEAIARYFGVTVAQLRGEPARVPVGTPANKQTFDLHDDEIPLIKRFRALPPESKAHIEGELARLFYQAQTREVFQLPAFPREALVIQEEKGDGKEKVPTSSKDARAAGHDRHAKKTAG